MGEPARLVGDASVRAQADERQIADQIAGALGIPFANDGVGLVAEIDRLIDASIEGLRQSLRAKNG